MDLIITQSILKAQNNLSRSPETPKSPYLVRENDDQQQHSRNIQQLFDVYELSDVEEEKIEHAASNGQTATNGLKKKETPFNHHKPAKEPKIVQICLIFVKIGEIDTAKERFKAQAYIQATWEDSSVNLKERFNPSTHWIPKLRIENAIGDLKQDIFYHVQVDAENRVCVTETRNVKGVFWERLELWDFPFDTQELSITVSTYHNESELKFMQDALNPCAVSTENFTNEQEWYLYNFVRTSKRTISDLWNNYKRPCFTATTLVKRKPGYFIYNAYLMIFFVSSLGFVPFSFDLANHHLRIQVTSLLILTAVNFRWVVTQRLPPVSYLTQLDKYAIVTLMFLVLGLVSYVSDMSHIM